MNILFISHDSSGGNLCLKLKNEGHSVKFFIADKKSKKVYDGIVEKTNNWEKELSWVGKGGLIIFDDLGYGKIQDNLRKEGYSVVGSSELGDKLENNRQYGQKIFTACGIPIASSQSFLNAEDAIKFVRKNKGPWVIKQNGHADKTFNYVGNLESGEDVIDVLKNYIKNNKKECFNIDLQKRIYGIEIGVARYFNGNDWVGPIEINIEHKDLFAGGLGPKTYEMGTLMWYDDNEKNKLFQSTLSKLKPYLQKANFKGDIDINCIVNEKKIYPLEVTARFGWPATCLHMELHKSKWGNFLKAIADGKTFNLKYKKEFGVVALVATPPFPYQTRMKKHSSLGEKINFRSSFSKKDLEHVYLEEVLKNKKSEHRIALNFGFVLHVGHTGKTVQEARKKVYNLIDKIVIPKMFYRNDIGLKFIQEDRKKLKKWGWI